jgi:alcohol dehydrogenase
MAAAASGCPPIMIASAIGANVVAVDLTEQKLDLARHRRGGDGQRHRHPGCRRRDPRPDRGGAHVSVDALGHPATCVNSIRSLRRRGRHIQVGLMLGDHARPPVPMDRVIAYELEILGSHGMQAFRYQAMLDMIGTGKLRRSF